MKEKNQNMILLKNFQKNILKKNLLINFYKNITKNLNYL